MVGACGTGAEDALPRLRYRLIRRENSWALGFMVCWMDREPIVRSLESAAIRTLRPCANNEMGKKESALTLKGAALFRVSVVSCQPELRRVFL